MAEKRKEVFWTRLDPRTRAALNKIAKRNYRSAAAEARIAIQRYVEEEAA